MTWELIVSIVALCVQAGTGWVVLVISSASKSVKLDMAALRLEVHDLNSAVSERVGRIETSVGIYDFFARQPQRKTKS